MNPVVDKSDSKFSWGMPDLENIRRFCSHKIGWTHEETDRAVIPALQQMESGSRQTRIESYFMKYDDEIKFAKVRSKRLKSVFHDVQKKTAESTGRKESSREALTSSEQPSENSKTSQYFEDTNSDIAGDIEAKDDGSSQEPRRKIKRPRVTRRNIR
eukprot:12502057-Ditylum_brightwellii.AAC.1